MSFLLSKYTLTIFTFFIIVGTSGIMTEQVYFLMDNYNLNFILSEVKLEEDIAILLASYGAFLECRPWISEYLCKNKIDQLSEKLNFECQKYGIFFILLAVFIECFDLALMAFETWNFHFPFLKFIEIVILLLLNILSTLLMIKFLYVSNKNFG